MRAVRLPYKTARALLALINVRGFDRSEASAVAELERALAVKPAVRERRKVKAAKKAEKRDETAEIRAAVVKRAMSPQGQPLCENCDLLGSELDHFFGRGKVPQKVSNCWFLCGYCHRNKTNNEPSATYWLEQFVSHCDRHGYTSEAWQATARLEALKAIPKAPKHVSEVDLVGDGVAARTWRQLQQQKNNEGGNNDGP